MATTTKRASRVEPAPHRIIARASEELRERARQVREETAMDREHIEAEGEQALQEALAAGKLSAVRVLFQPHEKEILQAIDSYARQHGLNSRAQVVRLALGKLLKVDVAMPKWGWPKGRTRKPHRRARQKAG
jgi:hypothetical protein